MILTRNMFIYFSCEIFWHKLTRDIQTASSCIVQTEASVGLKWGTDFQGQVWKGVWNILVWNRVRVLRTLRHTPTQNVLSLVLRCYWLREIWEWALSTNRTLLAVGISLSWFDKSQDTVLRQANISVTAVFRNSVQLVKQKRSQTSLVLQLTVVCCHLIIDTLA